MTLLPLTRKIVGTGAVAGLLITIALLVAPISIGNSEFSRALEDASHAPLFALVAIGLLIYKQTFEPYSSTHYGFALLGAILLGITGELVQLLFTATRHAQLKDVIVDASGAIAGLCLYASRDTRLVLSYGYRKSLPIVFVAMCAITIAPIAWAGTFYVKRARQAPELLTWDTAAGWHFLHAGGSDVKLTVIPGDWNTSPNEIGLLIAPRPDVRWAGITIEEPMPDWTLYNQLEIEVINPNDAPLELNIRIDDRDHNQEFNDRFNRSMAVTPHRRETVRIPLVDIQHAPTTRTMQLKKMSRIVLFEDTLRSSHVFYLCGIRLVK